MKYILFKVQQLTLIPLLSWSASCVFYHWLMWLCLWHFAFTKKNFRSSIWQFSITSGSISFHYVNLLCRPWWRIDDLLFSAWCLISHLIWLYCELVISAPIKFSSCGKNNFENWSLVQKPFTSMVYRFLLPVLNIVSLVISFYFCYCAATYQKRLHVKENW